MTHAPPPSPDDRLEERLVDLELKASWADDLLEALNATVARQQLQIDTLSRALAELRTQVAAGPGDAPRSLRDDLPPHY
ncbi:SlyX family protein [Rubrivivax albus]|uniref:SlyX family protein n=1 Tax=Rubrivivax albus TaxID=2499835 RepID=A0A437JYI0_9BURK|nr:SlyX family protein [Rubrivivax albus]RVT52724.1 SlyX family protein [Rubrivivax albus]